MNENDYTPDFVEVLNAWERNPPLQAEFVFDLPPEDPRRTDKVGVLMYQAVLLRQDHPALDFARIKAVTFTSDVHRSGDALEKAVGHELPQFRSAAARLEVFHVNIGAGQVLVITDDVANASVSAKIPTRLAAWEMLRNELARSVAVAWLAEAGLAAGPGTSAARWQAYARNVWSEYFCGLHAVVDGLSTDMARLRLRESLEQDPAALMQARDQHGHDHDDREYAARAEGCVRGLCEAMAEVLGQLQAQGTTLARIDPPLDTLLRACGLTPLWQSLDQALRAMGSDPHGWPSQPWDGLWNCARACLNEHGLRYGADAVLLEVLPDAAGKNT